MNETRMHVEELLRALKLKAVLAVYEETTERAAKNNLQYEEYLVSLFEEELKRRQEASIRAKVGKAKFPFIKTMDEFDFSFQPSLKERKVISLASLTFIEKKENVIFLGPPGVGKTHLSVGIGIKACMARYRVLFTSAQKLIEELVIAQRAGSLMEKLLFYSRLNLLIIATGLPLLWEQSTWARALRLLLMLSLLNHAARVVRHMLAQNRLGPILAAIVIVTTLGGAIIGYFDPAFARPLDGIWWAWVTVTTVGYGDMVPQTPAARVFAVLLMLLGVSMIALLSASLVAFFQEDEEREARHVRRMIWMKLQHMEDDAEQRARHHEDLLARLAAIELALLRAVEDRAALERKFERLLARDTEIRDAAPKGDAPHAGPDG